MRKRYEALRDQERRHVATLDDAPGPALDRDVEHEKHLLVREVGEPAASHLRESRDQQIGQGDARASHWSTRRPSVAGTESTMPCTRSTAR
ncbi:MAG: hypothetical protein IPL61_09490 [Myxococcales bacterium]|nr:hypothetical protein [Myxococcales bacterium]